MEIKSISQKIFRTAPEKTQSNHTNPFGVNFKGNMINADVFDVSFEGSKESLVQKATNGISNRVNKLKDAMNIGSINSFVSSRLESVANFGRRIKAGAVNAWNNINESVVRLEVDKIGDKIKSSLSIQNYSKNHLKKNPVEHLSGMMENLIEAIAKERAVANA